MPASAPAWGPARCGCACVVRGRRVGTAELPARRAPLRGRAEGFGARGFPFASLIKTGVLVWDRSSLGEELRREWLSCQGVVDAQLDAYVGGSGEWATGADDDDDYEDECVAGTWRDGGVLSEANA